MKIKVYLGSLILIGILTVSCEKDEKPKGKDPDKAEEVSVDRFSAAAGTLMIRDATNGLPEANDPIYFDSDPFITKGLGPEGELVEYYDFDVQPLTPAPIYILVKQGTILPVLNQLAIIDVIPGDAGYNDFWQVVNVEVPSGYVANTVTSYQEIIQEGYNQDTTDYIFNCPVVPKGSTATKRIGTGGTGLSRGWYRGKIAYYFNFLEADLSATLEGNTPTSPIYVTFNINPGDPGGGPPSGAMVETGTSQTHNVIATIPGDLDYSPLWAVNVYDNADFDNVSNLATAEAANILMENAMYVNCPVVSVQQPAK
jgi:hypothetical protein